MKRRRLGGAFTLVEMLTVIAIITILAGLIIPTVIGAMRNARQAVMTGMMSNLQTAIQVYYDDWNAYPPDSMEPNPASMGMDDDTHPSTPAECLAFYLGTSFTPRQSVGRVWIDDGSGGRKRNDDDTNTDGVDDEHLVPGAREVSATKTAGPYYKADKKFVKGFRVDVWPSLTDAWDQPLLYNAPGGLYGEPLHNSSSYDLFTFGVNGESKEATVTVRQAYTLPAMWTDTEWDTIMTDAECGNDVDPNYGGNRYDPTNDYVEEEADDINNW